MANRKITNEQFDEGVSIDGTRIEKAYQDTYNFLDAIPKNSLKQIFVPRTIYSGWQTPHLNFDYTSNFDVAHSMEATPNNLCFPFYNNFDKDVQGILASRTSVTNPWRWKGSYVDGITPTKSRTSNDSYITSLANATNDMVGRTWSYYFDKPTIITDITVIWERDYYTGLYFQDNTNYSDDNPTIQEKTNKSDIFFGELLCDSAFSPDDKRKASVLWRRISTETKRIDALPINTGSTPNSAFYALEYSRTNNAPRNDFLPNNYQTQIFADTINYPNYQYWWDKNLSISIPEGSRVHFGLGAVVNENFYYHADTPTGRPAGTPMNGYRINIAIGILETLE